MDEATQSTSHPLEPAPGLPAEGRLKMHLRLLRLGGSTCRVVTLRPSTRIGFSTNFFHETWHLVTSQRGARLLARLLWGLSYQRHPGTVLLVHGDHLLPTPFEAERSDPFLLVPAGITSLDASALRTLKSLLNRLGPPTTTIRWHTFGLDAALRARHSGTAERSEKEHLERQTDRLVWRQERIGVWGASSCTRPHRPSFASRPWRSIRCG